MTAETNDLLMPARREDAAALADLRNAAAGDLTRRHGPGPWAGKCSERGVLASMRDGTTYLARSQRRIVATLKLGTTKPWAIDLTCFTPVERPLYLTNMVVAPDLQRNGLGRACLAQAAALARQYPADAIRLDAFDHPQAGAGPFYAKCGYRETGQKVYRGVPLRYYELLLS